MIRQGVVQEALADFNAPSVLPQHLPQWSRVNHLDKARYPKAFLKDRLQPLPQPGSAGVQDADPQELQNDNDLSSDAQSAQQRVQHLEKSLHFLRNQHRDVLSNLHEEIDKLKRDNKELHFNIVMLQKSGSPGTVALVPLSDGVRKLRSRDSKDSSAKRRQSGTRKAKHDLHQTSLQKQQNPEPVNNPPPDAVGANTEDLRSIFLEDEINELKQSLKEERQKNRVLQQLVDTTEKEMLKQHHSIESVKDRFFARKELQQSEQALADSQAKQQELARESQAQAQLGGPLPFNASLNPLTVHLPAQPPRQPSLRECEVIIRHLQMAGDKQTHELNQLKSDLRDVLYSHKWTPDAYLLAKAYIADDDAREAAETSKLPKMPLKQSTRKLKPIAKEAPDGAYLQRDVVSLPPLKTGVGNQHVERRKRTQILQKAKMRKEIRSIDQ